MSFTGQRKGRLIVFEGIDGTGKSTHIGHLRKYLEDRGLEVVQSFEPTRGPWGRMLRDSAVTGRLSVQEEVNLFLKDRREHVETLIAPALARGAWVLLDRYYLSMMAYQGARGVDPAAIRAANEEFAPVPDAVVWLDIPVSVALERIGSRADRLPQRLCLRSRTLDAPRGCGRRTGGSGAESPEGPAGIFAGKYGRIRIERQIRHHRRSPDIFLWPLCPLIFDDRAYWSA